MEEANAVLVKEESEDFFNLEKYEMKHIKQEIFVEDAMASDVAELDEMRTVKVKGEPDIEVKGTTWTAISNDLNPQTSVTSRNAYVKEEWISDVTKEELHLDNIKEESDTDAAFLGVTDMLAPMIHPPVPTPANANGECFQKKVGFPGRDSLSTSFHSQIKDPRKRPDGLTSAPEMNIPSKEACDARFSQSGQLEVHNSIHTWEKPYACDVCDARFAKSSIFKTHKRIHTGKKPYTCDVCDARFAQLSNLKSHKIKHIGEKPYSCDGCDSRFAKPSQLKMHKRMHTGEKPYVCDVCDARFAKSSILKTHKMIHTGEKPYACDVCDARFAFSSRLKVHKMIHTGEKQYACDVCDARFPKSSRLKVHKMIHTGEKPYLRIHSNDKYCKERVWFSFY